jgi:hypothetical protein
MAIGGASGYLNSHPTQDYVGQAKERCRTELLQARAENTKAKRPIEGMIDKSNNEEEATLRICRSLVLNLLYSHWKQ